MLYVNGCSYAGYPDWSWGHELSVMLDKEIHFAARSGKSNQSIIRETIADLIKIKGITHAIISLTFIDRFDVYYDDKILSINPGSSLERIKDDRIRTYIKYRTLINSSKLILLDLFSNLVALKFFTESLGIKFFVFWGANEIDVLANTEVRTALLPFERILIDNSLDLFNFSFCLDAFNKNYINHDEKHFKQHAHPPPDAHKKFAEMLYNHVK